MPENPIGEPNPQPIEHARRHRFFHRGGNMAVERSVAIEPIDNYNGLTDESELFGLEQQMAEYRDLWEGHLSFTNEAFNDKVLKFNFNNLLSIYSDSLQAPREKKQAIIRLANSGYPKFVGLYIAAGRMEAAKHSWMKKDGFSGGDPEELYELRDTFQNVRGKLAGLLNPRSLLVPGDGSEQVNNHFLAIREDAEKTYKPIYKLDWEMSKHILNQISAEPTACMRLINTFAQHAQSDVEIEKTFARYLANRYDALGAESELGVALETMNNSAVEGGLASSFISAKLSHNDGDNILSYFAAKSGASIDNFTKSFSTDFADWPTDYKTEYAQFAQEKCNQAQLSVKKYVQQAKYRPWTLSDAATVEESIDKLWLTIYRNYNGARIRVQPAQKGRVAPKIKYNPDDMESDVLSAKVVEAPKPKILKGLTQIANGEYISSDSDTIAEITHRLLGDSPRAKQYAAVYSQVIEQLRQNSMQRKGVSSITDTTASHILVDGKKVRLYRAEPAKIQEVAVPRELQGGRVIFTANKTDLGVVAILPTHKEYTQFIRSL